MGMNPFLDDGDAASDDDDLSKFEIDQEFAKRYEHNKKREDLQKYEEMKQKGLINDSDDEDESDDEDDELDDLASGKQDLKFFEALIKVKKQDPILKQKDVNLFDSDSDGNENDDDNGKSLKKKEKKVKKEKKMYLKDVIAKQLLEDAPKSDDDGDDDENGSEEDDGRVEKVKTLAEEQEEARRAFLEAAEAEFGEADEDEDFLKFKGSENGVMEIEDEEEKDVMKSKLDEYFGSDDELDPNSRFLKDFFRKKLYLEKDENEMKIKEEVEKLSESEEEVEEPKGETEPEEEMKYRFEEDAGDRVMGYSRNIAGSVRKKLSKRKEQRLSKEQRRAIAEVERQEEVKHLKNLKRQEYMEKIRKVKEVGGIDEEKAWALQEDLEEEFDQEKHESKMKELYGDDYYGAEEADPEFVAHEYEDDEKPDFDKEDELLGLPKGWYQQYKGEEEAEEKEGKKKRKKKQKGEEEPVEVAKVKEEMNEELFKMDYEDTIGDLKTRFRYTKVKPQSFGLNGRDLILMDEKKLKQYVPVKKLAPYRENEFKLPRGDKYKLLLGKKELYDKLTNGNVTKKDDHCKENDEDFSDNKNNVSVKDEAAELELSLSAGTESKKSKKRREKEHLKENDEDELSNPNDAVKVEVTESELDAEAGSESRKSKKKRRKSGLNMSESRLMAYGKIPSKSKSKA